MAGRLSPAARRKQLLGVAGDLLTEGGVEAVRIPDVAAHAQVTRPVVYRFFPNRQALLIGVLEDFAGDLEARLIARAALGAKSAEDVVRALAEACCDAIEEKGAGAWGLLDTTTPDPQLAAVARAMHQRLVEPWIPRIAEITDAREADVRSVVVMMVASARAALGLWTDGQISRAEAVDAVIRGLTALLTSYTVGKRPFAAIWAGLLPDSGGTR